MTRCSNAFLVIAIAILTTCHSSSDVLDRLLNKEQQENVKDALSQLRVIAEEKFLGTVEKQKRENQKVNTMGYQEPVMKRHESNLLFEGDIILSPEQASMVLKSLKARKQKR